MSDFLPAQSRGVPVVLTNAAKRTARIRVLAEELHAKCKALDDDKTRARCRTIAVEIAGLIQAEDAHQRAAALTKSRAPQKPPHVSTRTP